MPSPWICWNVNDTDANNRALVRLLPDWLPLWTPAKWKDRLVFISPQLMKRYEEACKPLTTEEFYDPEPPYHLDEAFAKTLKAMSPAEKAAFDETVKARKKAQAEKVAAFKEAQAAKKK